MIDIDVVYFIIKPHYLIASVKQQIFCLCLWYFQRLEETVHFLFYWPDKLPEIPDFSLPVRSDSRDSYFGYTTPIARVI